MDKKELPAVNFWQPRAVDDVLSEANYSSVEWPDILAFLSGLLPIYRGVIQSRGLPLHAALAQLNGRGVLLAGPGGVGKTTCSRRLLSPWRSLSDDESLVICNSQGGYHAHPFPTWSDYLLRRSRKIYNVSTRVPLAGIFFLRQSQTDDVQPVGTGEAALLLKQSAVEIWHRFWRNTSDREKSQDRQRLFDNACEMVRHVPTYRLMVSRHGRFWEKIEEVVGM